MQTIIINEKNAEKIMAIFKKAQGKSTARIITEYANLAKIVIDIDRKFADMPKKVKEGIYVQYDFGQHFPHAYKYRPESTNFTIIFKGGHWRLIVDSVERWYCSERVCPYTLKMPDTAAGWIIEQIQEKGVGLC